MPDQERLDDAQVEALMRRGMNALAGQADVTGLARSVTARRRLPVTWLAAATAVVVAGGVTVAVVHERSGRPGTQDVAADKAIVVPDDWRWESYDGVQLRVPPDWGWGGSPFVENFGDGTGPETLGCGVQAMLMPGDGRYEQAPRDAPYVGRPVLMTDMCALPDRPTAPTVWFGSLLEPGRDSAGGLTWRTVAIGDQRVTVAATTDGTVERILATAEAAPVDVNGCAATIDGVPVPGGTAETRRQAVWLGVCAYDYSDTVRHALLYSTRVTGSRVHTAYDAIAAAAHPPVDCANDPGAQWVTLQWVTRDGARAQDIVGMTCGQFDTVEGQSRLTRRTAQPWAVDGVPAYVVGPTAGGVGEFTDVFRGMMG